MATTAPGTRCCAISRWKNRSIRASPSRENPASSGAAGGSGWAVAPSETRNAKAAAITRINFSGPVGWGSPILARSARAAGGRRRSVVELGGPVVDLQAGRVVIGRPARALPGFHLVHRDSVLVDLED